MSLEERRNKLLQQLEALKIFPNNNEVRILRARIQKQLERIEKQIVEKEIAPIEKIKTISKRSSKLSKYWHYIRLIRDNFPDLTIKEIRKQFAKRKRGDEVSIPDAVWQNPSP